MATFRISSNLSLSVKKVFYKSLLFLEVVAKKDIFVFFCPFGHTLGKTNFMQCDSYQKTSGIDILR